MITKYYNKDIDRKVILPWYLIQSMYHISRNHLPNEYGGILVGYKGEKCDIIIDFEVPESFKQSSTGFTRYTDSLNQYLKDVFTDSNGKLEYLGEWHTHPFAKPDYSHDDYKSMKEIAEEGSSKNSMPLLIILGIKKNSCEYNVYKYCEGKLLICDMIK